MDEPTSVLTPQAVAQLFETLRTLAAEGCSILYISHKLDEIRALCHARDGPARAAASPAMRSAPRNVGIARADDDRQRRCRIRCTAARTPGAPALVVDALDVRADDPFGTDARATCRSTVHAGEIVGIAGVSGNGQQELLAALSGERRARARRCDHALRRRRPARSTRRARRGRGSRSCPKIGWAAARSPS